MSAAPDRTPRGHFIPGHDKPGPGNPQVKKLAAYRKAVRRAVTARDLEAVFKALLEAARTGDVLAARELFDRCLGKATTAPQTVKLDLPAIVDPKGCTVALAALLEALGRGDIDPNQAAAVAALIEAQRRALETTSLTERIAAIEAQTTKGKR